jgi:ATP-dependent DNA helicase RecQ
MREERVLLRLHRRTHPAGKPDPRREPVLLVDDLVDSRWTLTVAAWLLRSHGSGEVWPFALAQAGGGP